MSWRPILTAVAGFALTAPTPGHGQSAARTGHEIFPLDIGNRWTFAGNVRSSDPESGTIYEKSLTWTMQVIDAVERQDLWFAIVTGYPADLAWHRDDRQPTRSIIVRVGSGAYYLVRGPRVDEVERRMRDGGDVLVGLIRDSEILLSLPLRAGKRFCEAEQRTRDDFFYCWVVESADDEAGRYRVTHRTIGDHRFIEYEAGTGPVSYVWGHHGSPGNIALELVAFERGSGEPTSP